MEVVPPAGLRPATGPPFTGPPAVRADRPAGSRTAGGPGTTAGLGTTGTLRAALGPKVMPRLLATAEPEATPGP
ncbi:hypothetical protein ACWC4E_16925 [Streptomyces sp. NPDC001273]|uniref:hypothetical protein n=1 Tax=unclassified Streptomyces TaxID=2593676 RepID=UPI0033EE855C